MDSCAPPSDAELFGRELAHVDGQRMGRIDGIVHLLDGERLALVRRGWIVRRWYRVPLSGAALRGGRVLLGAAARSGEFE